jgi:hypothetical protein
LLLGRRRLAACARLGRDDGPQRLLARSFPRGRGPVPSTFSRRLRALEASALADAWARWVRSRWPADVTVLSLDGKTLRGRRPGEIPGQHLVAADAPPVEAVLGQWRGAAKPNEPTAALQRLGILPVRDQVVSGDAAFCPRDLAETSRAAGGDDVFTVQAKQPGLEPASAAGFGFEAAARSVAAAFSPGTTTAGARPGGDDAGQGPRPAGAAPPAGDDGPDAPSEVAGPEAGV